jgi:hypothetical protein
MESIILAGLIVSVIGIPLAWQDMKSQEVSVYAVIGELICCFWCAFVFKAYGLPLSQAFIAIGIFLGAVLFAIKKMTPADAIVVIAGVCATAYIGALALMLALTAAFFFGAAQEKFRGRKYPFLTVYFVATFAISVALLVTSLAL